VSVGIISRLAKPQTGHTNTDCNTISLILIQLCTAEGKTIPTALTKASSDAFLGVKRYSGSLLVEIHFRSGDARDFLQRFPDPDRTDRASHVLYLQNDCFQVSGK